ncbi:Avr9/Cf-9 rapidly elicited protein 146 [Striga asiatica]|uniref:Avr9/Cf-9 rapidly elicited protein 146 n=1 Tax=Striga asiatica TaxID=4170 RepID=A0A5A7R4H6_STRAF|nr:Avr9/Cf-9 rapidly elicited protein 146 [Striga asiatica]
MEHNFPAAAKKLWHAVRVAYFVLRKNVSRPKLLADLSAAMKRGKIAGKSAAHNLAFHRGEEGIDRQIPRGEYEFSCSETPAHRALRLTFRMSKRKRSPSPPRAEEGPSEEEILAAAAEEIFGAAAASPDLPGFGGTAAVRQLRVTDSPFPVVDAGEDCGRVDEAAERFIMKFYRDLKRQNNLAG